MNKCICCGKDVPEINPEHCFHWQMTVQEKRLAQSRSRKNDFIFLVFDYICGKKFDDLCHLCITSVERFSHSKEKQGVIDAEIVASMWVASRIKKLTKGRIN